jgi:CheY-like chemotaxis protein
MQNHTSVIQATTRRQVMIVDDVEAVRKMVHTVLEHAGYDIVEAMSGEEAIAYMARHADPFAVHAMVCDIIMPGTDGQDIVRHFRTHYPWVSVIVLTACPDMTMAYDLLKLGVFQYLLKPIAHDQLREAVDRCVSEAVALRGRASWTNGHSEYTQRATLTAETV